VVGDATAELADKDDAATEAVPAPVDAVDSLAARAEVTAEAVDPVATDADDAAADAAVPPAAGADVVIPDDVPTADDAAWPQAARDTPATARAAYAKHRRLLTCLYDIDTIENLPTR
jgi:hypothetical protein